MIIPFSLPATGLKNGYVVQFWSIETWGQAFLEGLFALKTSPFCHWMVSYAQVTGSVAASCILRWSSLGDQHIEYSEREGKTGVLHDNAELAPSSVT